VYEKVDCTVKELKMNNEQKTELEFNLDGTITVTKSTNYTSKDDAYKAAGIIEYTPFKQPDTLLHKDVTQK
jgi:hypothetical protein